MIGTFQAVVVFLLAFLPGASYTYAFERVVGPYGVRLGDRLLRFLVVSAVFHTLFLWGEVKIYRAWVESGALVSGGVPARDLWAAAGVYLLIPISAGLLIGNGTRHEWRVITFIFGANPQPTAWEYVWTQGKSVMVRARLKSGCWVAGVYGTFEDVGSSYSSAFGEAQDVYLAKTLKIDPVTGKYVDMVDGVPVCRNPPSGLLVRWDEIEYLEAQVM
ncbi:MAG: DUF6338 family protein [Nocardioidaceae bacterium]|nr:DUF6338 family protein [Nocardioidaceae bacterium]